MRLTVHHNPPRSSELERDLTKLYHTLPADLDQHHWFVATFNDRHIAALRLDGEKLGRLAVRIETWRRGVGSYLLSEAEKAARELGLMRLFLVAAEYPEENREGLGAFLETRGYERTPDGWQKTL
ncbi:acetyl-CoA sensor PanZ family protein [Gallaecimonas sp. GXIMD4217]|uniref:acetyl-CoA sensor PanZ family protein n=1 Tax=Gallaecimonas sp. GXIMD4217 TaxID=3131927 RepID=UPI00311B24C7